MHFGQLILGVVVVAVFAPRILAQDAKIEDTVPPVPDGKLWKMAWSDEFDGTVLDSSKWECPPDGPRRDGYWMKKAVTLDGRGHLVINVLCEDDKYIDGCVRTKGRFERTFGYYVARIQFNKQSGHWAGFWLFNNSVERVGDGGRDGAEIDIVEKPLLEDQVQQTLHWDGYGEAHKQETRAIDVRGVSNGFHTFGLLWTPDVYVFYVDGKETWRTTAGGVCQVPLYIKLSDEISHWVGDIRKAQLPDPVVVDYVRVYDLIDK